MKIIIFLFILVSCSSNQTNKLTDDELHDKYPDVASVKK